MRVAGWTIRKRKALYILNFENSNAMTPDITLTERQFADFLREGIKRIGPDKIRYGTEIAGKQ